jgi:hypothetical protein
MESRLVKIRILALIVPVLALVPGCGTTDAETRSLEVALSTTGEQEAEDRLFEMRTYTAHPGKLEDLHRRFRDHTTRFFEKHGMDNIGYWAPQEEDLRENTIVYILAYPSMEARDASWGAFRADPEWLSARADSESNGPLVESVLSQFFDPTDYSPIR